MTPVPTPARLTPAQIFESISPSIAFIQTEIGTGTGILVDGGYLITNAHVVWPLDWARVVFPDRSEQLVVPLVAIDLLGDLAILGPIDTLNRPLELEDGERLPVGSEVFVIGYPGEYEGFPQPTLGRGLLSRVREWRLGNLRQMTFLQTDAAGAGGQSGGALVSADGNVIGMTGLAFTEAGFLLAASAADLAPRVRQMISGPYAGELGTREVPSTWGLTVHNYALKDDWVTQVFVIRGIPGSEFELSIDGPSDVVATVSDSAGNFVIEVPVSATSSTSFAAESFAPYFVVAWQEGTSPISFVISCNCQLIPYPDRDDGDQIEVGRTIVGALDYPGDYDKYEINLKAGNTLDIVLESAMFDPLLFVSWPGATDNDTTWDWDSGGGLMGTSSMTTFRAPHDGTFFIGVMDTWDGAGSGGYVLSVTKHMP